MIKHKHSVLRNSLWVMTSSVSQRVIGFVVGIIMARLLAPADFGLIVTMSVFTGIAGYFAAGGMGDALIRSKQIKPTDYSAVFTAQWLVCLLIYLGFFLVAPSFSRWMDEPRYEMLLRVSALTFLLRPVLNVASSKISREMRFRDLSMIRLTTFTVTSLCGITFALLGLGPWALVLSGLSGPVVTAPLLLWRAHWLPAPRWDVPALRRLAMTGMKFSANHILDYMRSQIPNFFISKFMGPAATGIFNRGSSLSLMPMQIIGGSLYEPLMRSLSASQDQHAESKQLFLRAIALLSYYAMPVYVMIWWLADPLIPVLYGEKWRATIEPLQILMLTGLLLVHQPSGALVAAQNRLGRELFLNVESIALLVALCVAALPYGPTGIAWVLVAVRLYRGLRIYGLAAASVGATWRELSHLLGPLYAINAVLVAILWSVHRAIPPTFIERYPVVYLAGFLGTGIVAYAVLSTALPFDLTRNESRRWQRIIRSRLRPRAT